MLQQFDALRPDVVVHTVEVKQNEEVKADEANDWVNEFADMCYLCHETKPEEEEERSLLVCDEGNFQVAHYQCMGLKAIPAHEWRCHKCRDERRKMKSLEKKQREKIRAKSKSVLPVVNPKIKKIIKKEDYYKLTDEEMSDADTAAGADQPAVDITDLTKSNPIYCQEDSDDEPPVLQKISPDNPYHLVDKVIDNERKKSAAFDYKSSMFTESRQKSNIKTKRHIRRQEIIPARFSSSDLSESDSLGKTSPMP